MTMLDVITNHGLWKEIINKNDRLLDHWASSRKEKPEQKRATQQRRPQMFVISPYPRQRQLKKQPIKLIGAGGDGKALRRVPKYNPPRISKPLQSKPIRACNRCQMTEYESPYPYETEICAKCNGLVTYHSFRCCLCGCEPSDPRIFLHEGTPKFVQYENDRYVEDDDEDWRDYYRQ